MSFRAYYFDYKPQTHFSEESHSIHPMTWSVCSIPKYFLCQYWKVKFALCAEVPEGSLNAPMVVIPLFLLCLRRRGTGRNMFFSPEAPEPTQQKLRTPSDCAGGLVFSSVSELKRSISEHIQHQKWPSGYWARTPTCNPTVSYSWAFRMFLCLGTGSPALSSGSQHPLQVLIIPIHHFKHCYSTGCQYFWSCLGHKIWI